MQNVDGNKTRIIHELVLTKKQEEKVEQMLQETRRESPKFYEEGMSKSFYVPVDDGEIRIFHIKPEKPVSVRPIVFIPGWGVIPRGFDDYYEVIHDKAECYYVETREKNSSKLNMKKARLDMSQKAKDISDAIKHLGLDKEDFVLVGTCWGSAIVLQGFIDGTLKAPTTIVVDPMHTLWFPKWLLKYVAPLTPNFVVKLLKPILKRLQLRGMDEPVQRQRAIDFIDNADTRKWKKAAIAVKDFELFNTVHAIKDEIIVFNGTTDTIHEQKDYPKLAKLMPNGRFIFMKTDESNRERLMAIASLEFSKITKDVKIPSILAEFEKKLKR